MDYIQSIKQYILFLKQHHNLAITLHPLKAEGVITSSELISFNIHSNSYCVYIKTCSKARHHCIQKQYKVFEKANEPFIGVCYAGVKEFVYPIFDGYQTIGFISVSGYQAENPNSYIQKIAHEYPLNYSILKNKYYSLKSEMPPKAQVDTLIFPLCQMLELAYSKNEKITSEKETFSEKVVQYLKEHKNEQITSANICSEFSCNRSYMSSQFNKFTGMSIREYINKLRVEDAKLLLKNSSLNITEIAFSVGFTNSNYFSTVFKNLTGLSPIKYRREG